MRLVDMLFFQAEHDDYHLARISEIKKIIPRKDAKLTQRRKKNSDAPLRPLRLCVNQIDGDTQCPEF
jgi:hypothetical protein